MSDFWVCGLCQEPVPASWRDKHGDLHAEIERLRAELKVLGSENGTYARFNRTTATPGPEWHRGFEDGCREMAFRARRALTESSTARRER